MPAQVAERPRRRTRGRPNEIDAMVGSRIRERRLLLGMSQTELADAVGITFQQLQKYERGRNRVGAGRLYELGRALHVPVAYFFASIDPKSEAALAAADIGPVSPRQRETAELIRSYYALPDGEVRQGIFDLIRVLGGPGDGDAAEADTAEPPA